MSGLYQTTLWSMPVAVVAVYTQEAVDAIIYKGIAFNQARQLLYAQDNEAQARYELAVTLWENAGGQMRELSPIWTAGIGENWKVFGDVSPSNQYILLCVYVPSGRCPHGNSLFTDACNCVECARLGEAAWWIKR